MKIALSILCSLMLLWAQLAVAAAPAAGAIAGQPMKHCCCGGKMSCCRHASAPQPLAATPQLGSQNQIVSAVPAAVWVLAAAEIPSIFSAAASVLKAADAPLFARHCARLI